MGDKHVRIRALVLTVVLVGATACHFRACGYSSNHEPAPSADPGGAEEESGADSLRESVEESFRAPFTVYEGEDLVEVTNWVNGHQVSEVLPEANMKRQLVTGLLRICMAEQLVTKQNGEYQWKEDDCVGIYQVLRNIRNSSCNRERIPSITQCDHDGETMLSSMRRGQPYAMGVQAPRTPRVAWISKLQTSCDMPENYSGTTEYWNHVHKRICFRTASVARSLVYRKGRSRITDARIIAWGGRCEDPRGACDDYIACKRGLVRIQSKTDNGFWCRPNTPKCSVPDINICDSLI